MGSLRPLSSGIPIWVATIVGVLAVLWLPLLRPLLTFFLFNKQIPLVGLQPFDPSIPQNSYFPEGCVWRDVEPNGSTAFWQKREYEYLLQARNPSCHGNVTEKCWDERWTREQPLACRLRTTRMNGFLHRLSNLETTVDCTESHCVIDNLWYNNGMFYGVFEQMDDPYETMALTQDIDLNALHVRSSQDFVRQLNATRVRGSTLLIDFVYFIHPTAIGHWLEHLMPLVSSLREVAESFQSPPSNIVLLHLKRTHVMPWVRTAIAAAIGTPAGSELPPMAFQEEQDSMWKQIGTPLEGIPSTQWISFDRVLVVKDVLTGGGRVAKTADDAAAFRTNAFKLHNIENHINASHTGTQARLRPPKTITLLRKSRDRRILNEDEVIELLSRYGPVQTVEFTAETPVEKQLAIMASTGILISTHTSALANSVFLPPGAAVIEIIHRNWLWQGLDLSFKVHSAAAGDRHHWAWRATTPDQVFYINPRDKVRFGGDDWAGKKCDTDECVEAHTNVDVIVNLDEFGQLLEDVVPKVWGGVSVINAERPWPGHSTP